MENRILPILLAERLRRQLEAEFKDFEVALQQDPVTAVRLNPAKPYQLPWPTHPLSWHPHARWLETRPAFTMDPGIHAGAYYVQDPATMTIYPAIRDLFRGPPVRVLDLCAAPGGKSTLLADLLRPQDLLIANEITPQRYHILHENLSKWGLPNVVTTSVSPDNLAKSLGAVFDIILVDAPCSGEGMIRKEPVALSQWNPGLITQCALRQNNILDAAWSLLAPGGTLIYSTCTFNPEENIDQVTRILRNQQDAKSGVHGRTILLPEVVVIEQGNAYGFQCWPHRIRGEGFFFSILQKEGDRAQSLSWKSAKILEKPGSMEVKKISMLVDTEPSELVKNQQSGMIYAVPSHHIPFVDTLIKQVVKAEPVAAIGNFLKDQFIPHPALALSANDQSVLPDLEMDLEATLFFLSHQSIPRSQPAGWYRITYQNLGLGWVKAVGNRLNNYYPKHWRIRHLRDE